MTEADTRANHIDPALAAAGWGVVPDSRILRDHPITLGRLRGAGGKRGEPDRTMLMPMILRIVRN